MFKVAAVCIDTSSESLPESKDGFIDWLLRQISPYDFQHRLEFRLVSGLGLLDSVHFQHCPPDVIVTRVEIRRVRWPFVFGDEIWCVSLQPFLCLTSGVSRRTVLLEDEGAGRYILPVLDQFWQKTGRVVFCVDFCFFRYEMQAPLASVADPCRYHHACIFFHFHFSIFL